MFSRMHLVGLLCAASSIFVVKCVYLCLHATCVCFMVVELGTWQWHDVRSYVVCVFRRKCSSGCLCLIFVAAALFSFSSII